MKKEFIALLILVLCAWVQFAYGAAGDVASIGGKAITAIASVDGKANAGIASFCGKSVSDGDASGNEWIGYETQGDGETLPSTGKIFCSGADAATSNGTISKISIYSEIGTGGNMKLGIYSGATPTTLVGAEEEFAITNAGNGWHEYTFSTGKTVVSGTTYWMCVSVGSANGIGIWYSAASNATHYMDVTYADAWPASFTSGGTQNLNYSMKGYSSW